jgi:hypothetical protein
VPVASRGEVPWREEARPMLRPKVLEWGVGGSRASQDAKKTHCSDQSAEFRPERGCPRNQVPPGLTIPGRGPVLKAHRTPPGFSPKGHPPRKRGPGAAMTQYVETKGGRHARPTGPRCARPEHRPCAGHPVCRRGSGRYRIRGVFPHPASLQDWVAERFRRHAGNADVARQNQIDGSQP